MTNIRTYHGWWDTSLTDRRNERALRSAFVAAIAVWATAFLLAVMCGQLPEPLAERSGAWDYKFALAIQALFPAGRTAPRLGLALIATSVRFFAFNFLIIFRT